jgi:hypothetical protein
MQTSFKSNRVKQIVEWAMLKMWRALEKKQKDKRTLGSTNLSSIMTNLKSAFLFTLEARVTT